MTSLSSDRPSGQTPPTAPSPATPAPSLREARLQNLAALMTWQYSTAIENGRKQEAEDVRADREAILALLAELASTRSALREAQEDAKRYRYLRDNGLAEALRCRDGLIEMHFGRGADSVTMKTGMVGGLANVLIDAAVDAAIDAAAGSATP